VSVKICDVCGKVGIISYKKGIIVITFCRDCFDRFTEMVDVSGTKDDAERSNWVSEELDKNSVVEGKAKHGDNQGV
jgi:hypothetical protein